MPYLTIKTNAKLASEKRKTLLQDASQIIASQLCKPENYAMISYIHCEDMIFAGNNEPLAYLELKSIGLPENKTPALSAALSRLLTQHLALPAKRIYIEFSSAKHHFWWLEREYFLVFCGR